MESQDNSAADPLGALNGAGIEDGRLLDSRRCRKCGYDLLGAQLSGLCSECGSPVAASIDGALFRYSPREHVRRLARGNAFATNGLLMVFLGSMLIVGLTATASPDGMDMTTAYVILGVTVAVLAGAVALGAGWWILAANEPEISTPKHARMKKRVRYSAVVYVVSLLSSTAAEFLQGYLGIDLTWFAAMAGIVSMASWIAMFYFGARLLRVVGNRIPDQKLEQQSRSLATVLLYVLGGYAMVATGTVLSLMMPVDASGMSATAALALITIGTLVAGLLSLIVLIRYARLASRLSKGLKSVLASMP